MVINRLDYKRRKLFLRHEIKRKALKSILFNQNLDMSLRWWAQLEKSKLPRHSSLSRIHNYCVETGRSRSVIKFFKLSRLRLRKFASNGVIPGLSKASW